MAELAQQNPEILGVEEIKTLLSRVELLEQAVLEQRLEPTRRSPANDADEDTEDVSFMNARSTNKEDTIIPTAIRDSSSKVVLHDTWELPESTFTLMITHKISSFPFFTALIACALALMCLILVFINELDKGTIDNPFALPAGVTTEVRMAQFVGTTIESILNVT